MPKVKKAKPLRFLTASSLFDGHDASINMVRRWLQTHGAEVIHLGHNRSVEELVKAAEEESVDAIAVTSYQGGHVEYFTYLVDQLKTCKLEYISVFGGGGGVISKDEAETLHNRGVQRIYRPEDGENGGVEALVLDMLKRCRKNLEDKSSKIKEGSKAWLSSQLQLIANGKKTKAFKKNKQVPILGFTGTGGAGKSTLIDECVKRFVDHFTQIKLAVLCIDPSRAATGGALLGDRMRYNSAAHERVFVHSVSTRFDHQSVSKNTQNMLNLMSQQAFDLIILETAGIGQSDYAVTELCDTSIYVMSSEYGASTQLEKINMFDYADFVILNKYDHRGAKDAFNDVRKAVLRCQSRKENKASEEPVIACCADQHHDLGVNRLFNQLVTLLSKTSHADSFKLSPTVLEEGFPTQAKMVSSDNYLDQISSTIHHYRDQSEELAEKCKGLQALEETQVQLKKNKHDHECLIDQLSEEIKDKQREIPKELLDSIKSYETEYSEDSVKSVETESGLPMPKLAFPQTKNYADIVRYLCIENKPGEFPYSSGLYPYKRSDEFPTRMFAGEGGAEQTNARFHLLCEGQKSIRLSTAFDSLTLYGQDPDKRPDINGKIGNSGVSICSLDDMKRLFSGFDLCADNTSVSMTINGPAIILLAFYFNTAVDAEIERRLKQDGKWKKINQKIKAWFEERNLKRPIYRNDLPEGHDGSGLGFLGLSSEVIMGKAYVDKVQVEVFQKLRGTLQADIFKEEQAQNTCLYSREFSLDLMAAVQSFFIENKIDKYYSVSVSGYHIAEAGANPITELAFTLANGFALVELYLSKGLPIDDFASNFSFFFSNGMDPEYAVLGQVARRIWAIAMRDYYKANDRSQKLKYHIQTSGRSLHAQNCSFNDIRTTLEALYATSDNCNSLHTNAYDEAISTPTSESVKRALAIQMILNQEYGLCKNDNPMQGSYLLRWLSDKVESEVLSEFRALHDRGGVLGAMDYHYQRNKIQEEAMRYEAKKASGEVKIIGVNTFTSEDSQIEFTSNQVRSSKKTKQSQVKQVKKLQKLWHQEAQTSLINLTEHAHDVTQLFPHILNASKYCTLGQISDTLEKLGGRYRRSM